MEFCVALALYFFVFLNFFSLFGYHKMIFNKEIMKRTLLFCNYMYWAPSFLNGHVVVQYRTDFCVDLFSILFLQDHLPQSITPYSWINTAWKLWWSLSHPDTFELCWNTYAFTPFSMLVGLLRKFLFSCLSIISTGICGISSCPWRILFCIYLTHKKNFSRKYHWMVWLIGVENMLLLGWNVRLSRREKQKTAERQLLTYLSLKYLNLPGNPSRF